MTKKRIRLTESDLHRIVNESVNRVLRENDSWSTFFDEKWEDFKLLANTLVSKIGKLEATQAGNTSVRQYANDVQNCIYKLMRMWPTLRTQKLKMRYTDYPLDDFRRIDKSIRNLGLDKPL